jgi:hypothetical protein
MPVLLPGDGIAALSLRTAKRPGEGENHDDDAAGCGQESGWPEAEEPFSNIGKGWI